MSCWVREEEQSKDTMRERAGIGDSSHRQSIGYLGSFHSAVDELVLAVFDLMAAGRLPDSRAPEQCMSDLDEENVTYDAFRGVRLQASSVK